MARPIAKASVNLASTQAPGPRVSRIRRDPPPVVKEKLVLPEERDQWAVIVGILTFGLAIFALTFAFSIYSGWTPQPIEVSVGE